MPFYFLALLVSLAGMLILDARYRLFLWRAPVRALLVLAAGVAMLLVADAVGIATGVFAIGAGPWQTGILLAPELPLDELVFLTFLCQFTMVLLTGAERVLALRTSRRES